MTDRRDKPTAGAPEKQIHPPCSPTAIMLKRLSQWNDRHGGACNADAWYDLLEVVMNVEREASRLGVDDTQDATKPAVAERDREIARLRSENAALVKRIAAEKKCHDHTADVLVQSRIHRDELMEQRDGFLRALNEASLRFAANDMEGVRQLLCDVNAQSNVDGLADPLREERDAALDRAKELRGALDRLQKAEHDYRLVYHTNESGHINVRRAWDRMRKAGDEARAAGETQ